MVESDSIVGTDEAKTEEGGCHVESKGSFLSKPM